MKSSVFLAGSYMAGRRVYPSALKSFGSHVAAVYLVNQSRSIFRPSERLPSDRVNPPHKLELPLRLVGAHVQQLGRHLVVDHQVPVEQLVALLGLVSPRHALRNAPIPISKQKKFVNQPCFYHFQSNYSQSQGTTTTRETNKKRSKSTKGKKGKPTECLIHHPHPPSQV